MAKPRRIQFRGATYHVMSRGNRKAHIFEDDCDRRRFLDIVSDALERYVVECPSFCLMGNHYHLIVHTPRANLAPFMKMVNGEYAKSYNRRHRLTGHLFGGPYKPIVIGDSCYLRTAMAYVARNPVEAGLVATPDKWKWSSYAAAVGLCDPEPFMAAGWMERAFPSVSVEESRQRFADLVVHFPGEMMFDERDVAFADQELRADVRELIGRTMYLSELPRAYRAMARPDLSEILSWVTRAERITAIRRAHVIYGYRLSEIARCMGIHPTTISRLLAKSRTLRDKAAD
jgi:putative transposase